MDKATQRAITPGKIFLWSLLAFVSTVLFAVPGICGLTAGLLGMDNIVTEAIGFILGFGGFLGLVIATVWAAGRAISR